MSKTWKIWIGLFVTAGVLGLAATGTTSLLRKQAAASYQEKFPKGTDKHLEKYEDFFNLAHAPELTEEQLKLFQQKKNELEAEQDALLKADLHDLATGKKDPSIVADFMYGEGWHEKVRKEKTIHAALEIIAITSTVSLLTGLILAAGAGIKTAAEKAKSKHKAKKQAKSTQQSKDKKTLKTQIKAAESTEKDNQDDTDEQKPAAKTDNEQKQEKQEVKKGKIGSVECMKTKEARHNHSKALDKTHASTHQKDHHNEQTLKQDEQTTPQTTPETKPAGAFNSTRLKQAGLTGVRFSNSNDENTQGGLSQQVAKLQNLMSTEPVKASISELTEQMSAIREFASQQQDRFRQLQDGYDWNVIKRFCLRIIRCIDNLDMKLEYLETEGQDTSNLEDVRDELLFALESSGVEKFTPETMSDYKGLERFAEAASQRQMTEDPELIGKVAKVVRPGYQYILNDNEVKVVRTAQVILFSQKLTAVSGVR